MARLTYHHHTIVSTPVRGDNTGLWKFAASVSCPQTGIPGAVRFFTSSPQLFRRFEDAEQAGLEAAKNCIASSKAN